MSALRWESKPIPEFLHLLPSNGSAYEKVLNLPLDGAVSSLQSGTRTTSLQDFCEDLIQTKPKTVTEPSQIRPCWQGFVPSNSSNPHPNHRDRCYYYPHFTVTTVQRQWGIYPTSCDDEAAEPRFFSRELCATARLASLSTTLPFHYDGKWVAISRIVQIRILRSKSGTKITTLG